MGLDFASYAVPKLAPFSVFLRVSVVRCTLLTQKGARSSLELKAMPATRRYLAFADS